MTIELEIMTYIRITLEEKENVYRIQFPTQKQLPVVSSKI